jgi:siroheme synthase
MMDIAAFNPTAINVTVVSGVASASGALPGISGNQIRIHNASTSVAFVRWTVGASTAVLTDTFIGAGGTEVFTMAQSADTFSVILAAGTGVAYAQRGFGL